MGLTLRQRVLKRVYPLLMWAGGKAGKQMVAYNPEHRQPQQSFHALAVTLSNGNPFSFASLRGKKVLVVNTASDCGYTPQYTELQTLYQQHRERLEIIAVPANDFKAQEKESDEVIADFCSVNYGVQFPLAKKTVVVKGTEQHPVFQWLSQKEKNGWYDKGPRWNFSKYLINEHGVLTHVFEPGVSPLSEVVLQALR